MSTSYAALQTIAADAATAIEALLTEANDSPRVAYNSVIRQLRHEMNRSIERRPGIHQASRHYPIRILIARATPGSEFGQWEYEASSAAPGVSPDQFSSPDSACHDAVFGPAVPALTVIPLAGVGAFVATQLGNYHAPNVPQTLALADKLQRALPSLRVQLSSKGYVRRVIEYPVADTEGNVTEYRAEIEVWAPAASTT